MRVDRVSGYLQFTDKSSIICCIEQKKCSSPTAGNRFSSSAAASFARAARVLLLEDPRLPVSVTCPSGILKKSITVPRTGVEGFTKKQTNLKHACGIESFSRAKYNSC